MKKENVEMVVGVFMVVGFLAFTYLALNLGEVPMLKQGGAYEIVAEFDNISGIKKGASVQIAGVEVGVVNRIWLGEDDYAYLALRISKDVKLSKDSMASVKSQGIIGEKYIQLRSGGSEELLAEGEVITDTESSLDIESLISKFAFSNSE